MHIDSLEPKAWLADARAAFREERYPEALERYTYFFDNALGVDRSWYGVRLSYCLDERAELAEVYPPAMEALNEKKKSKLSSLRNTKDPQLFNDFSSICEYLKLPNEPIQAFVQIHNSDRALAGAIVRFIWDDLVRAKQWDICKAYLLDWQLLYNRAVEKLEGAMAPRQADPNFGGQDYDKLVASWYVRDVSNIILVLQNTGHEDSVDLVRRRISDDMEARNQAELLHQIDELVAG